MTIVGATPTGSELSAEPHRIIREVVAYRLDRIDPERDIRIVLIEAVNRVLPGLAERISKATHCLLDKIGIEARTDAKVTEVTPEALRLADRGFGVVGWAAGVRAPSVLPDLDELEVNRINQLVVEPTLLTTRDPSIFAIRDCAACPQPGKAGTVPPRSQAAHQEVAHMLRQIERRQGGRPLQPSKYRDFGSLMSVRRGSTVGNLVGFCPAAAFSSRACSQSSCTARCVWRTSRRCTERRTPWSRRSRALSRRTCPAVKLH